MKKAAKSRNALDGKIVKLRSGLAIYKVNASPFYRVRVWIPSQRKRVVRTTKADNRADAIAIAEEMFASMGTRSLLAETPIDKTFQYYASRLVEDEKVRGLSGQLSTRQSANTRNLLENKTWGAIKHIGQKDVREIQTKDYLGYIAWVRKQDPTLSPGTLNHLSVAFRKVLSVACADGVIDAVPATPREKRKDNPRPFFRFHPLVDKKHDEYQQLLKSAKALVTAGTVIRHVPITDELHDFILFLAHSFLRPTISEVYALTHRDVTLAESPKRLVLTIKKGKTGHRVSNTMEAAVSIYKRIQKRHEGFSRDDFLFLPQFTNRKHAQDMLQRQFNAALEHAGLKQDHYSNTQHTLYSLRHTSICMRLVLSHGKVNIFNLAKNAGTSVDQIERFYAKNLPLSAELARNLQSFGE